MCSVLIATEAPTRRRCELAVRRRASGDRALRGSRAKRRAGRAGGRDSAGLATALCDARTAESVFVP